MTKREHKSNGHQHATETPDVSHIKNVDVTHEMSDVNVPALLKFVGALTVMTIAVYILMWGLFRFFNTQLAQQEQPPGPMALSEQERLPPEPRLQGARGFADELAKSVGDPSQEKPKDPLWEIRVLRQQWENSLKEPKDSSGNPIGLPIEEAMKKVVEQGLASRSKPGSPQELPEQGISIPTAASSGRVTRKGN